MEQTTTPDGGGLVRKKLSAGVERNSFYIRRGDTPGLRWRVDVASRDVEDELLDPAPPTTTFAPSQK